MVDSRQIFKILNELKGKVRTKEQVGTVKVDEIESSDPHVVGDAFNEFFATIGEKTQAKHPQPSHKPQFIECGRCVLCYPVNELKFLQGIDTMKSKCSCGLDDVSSQVINANAIVPKLTEVLNASILNGDFPDVYQCQK